MATIYIETKPIANLTKKEVAEKFSETLWNLKRPKSVKHPDDVTKYLFGFMPHPTIDDDWVVVVDDSDDIKKHIDAISNEMVEVVNGLSNTNKTTLRNYIDNNETLTVKELINSLRDEIVSYTVWSDLVNGHSFSLGDKVSLLNQSLEDNQLVFYNCIQAHSKQSDWSPENTPALWSEIKVVGDIEVWSKPIGGDGRYPNINPNTKEAYKVTHNGKTWENIVPAPTLNVWQPSVYGWREIL